ncbi:MAG: hypothetical protein WCP09_02665 [Candidatus Taylorbacteria bacterium]
MKQTGTVEMPIENHKLYCDSFGESVVMHPNPGDIVFIDDCEGGFSRQPVKITSHLTMVQLGDAD